MLSREKEKDEKKFFLNNQKRSTENEIWLRAVCEIKKAEGKGKILDQAFENLSYVSMTLIT